MTKKQLKQLAKKFAALEIIIQSESDRDAVDKAKNEQIKLTESTDLEFDDMIKLDLMIQEMLKT